MCLEISQTFKTRKEARNFIKCPNIVSKDLKVYKILCDDDDTSPYYHMKYEKGTHYYRDGRNKFSSKIEKLFNGEWFIEIHKGLHAYMFKHKAKEMVQDGEYIVEMVIPKGSEVFMEGDEIVTDNLIWY